ncbi:MAG: hypothetical protein GX075_05105 [Firmicutes bacterium]|nr:hypothetical protein [Bacillota bacterium]
MRTRAIITASCLILICLLLITGRPIRSETGNQVLIIDIPRLTFEDLDHAPNFRKFLASGAVGLMTVSATEPVTLEKVYLGFNAGAQLIPAAGDTLLILGVNEEFKRLSAGGLYRSLSGYDPPSNGGVHLGLAKLIQVNSGSRAQNIGLLGRLLHSNNRKTAAIGNADAESPNRGGALLLMDEKGQIDYAALGAETLTLDPDFPYELITDDHKIISYWRAFQKDADVIVITLGDLERLERFGPYLNEQRWEYYRRSVMERYDRLFESIQATIEPRSTLTVLLSGIPPARKAGVGEKLMPVALAGPGIQPGVLKSDATRQIGVIAEYDIPAAILSFLGIKKTGRFNGQSLGSVPGDWRQVSRLRPQLVQNYRMRWPLLTGYAYLLIGSALAGIIGLCFKWPPRFLKLLTFVYLSLLMIPAVFLVEAAFNPLTWLAVLGLTLILAALFWALVVHAGGWEPFRALSLISAATVILIAIDGLGNGFWGGRSFLGYSPVSGSRFYGIGNEYLGFLLGAYIAALSLNLKFFAKYRETILKSGRWFIALLVAHPNFGANIGGGVTAILGLGITNLLLLKKRVGLKEIGRLFLELVGLLTLVGLWDLWFGGSRPAHFGRLLFLIREGGFPVVKELALRKWELNLRLINYTPWSKVLLGILILVPLLYCKPSPKITELMHNYPERLTGFLGLVFTALIALLVNDTGIVAVATLFVFGGVLLLLVLFDDSAKGVISRWAQPKSK